MMPASARRCQGCASHGVAGAAGGAEGPGPLGACPAAGTHPAGSRTGGALCRIGVVVLRYKV